MSLSQLAIRSLHVKVYGTRRPLLLEEGEQQSSNEQLDGAVLTWTFDGEYEFRTVLFFSLPMPMEKEEGGREGRSRFAGARIGGGGRWNIDWLLDQSSFCSKSSRV